MASPFFHAMLDPIYELLKDDVPCLMTEHPREMVAYKPHVLVHAGQDAVRLRPELPDTVFVWTRHGFANKKIASRIAVAGCDIACVSSDWVCEEYDRRGWRPRVGYWVTGFVPMDEALSAEAPPCSALLPEDFADGSATLLYAPTWNRLLSSAGMLGRQWIDHIREVAPSVNVIIKPHPAIPKMHPRWMDGWLSDSLRNDRTLLVEDTHSSVYPYFLASDILLTDASSVMFYFLALNRPIVLVNNPHRFRDHVHFDPSSLEWQWRDMGIEIENESELPHAISRCLQHPEEKAPQRSFYRQRVFGELLDGRAAERTTARINSLLQPEPVVKEWVEHVWRSVRSACQTTSSQHGVGVQLEKRLWELFVRHPRLRLVWLRAAERFPRLHYAIARARRRIRFTPQSRSMASRKNAED